MIALLKRHWISISLLMVSSAIGLIVWLIDSPVDIWLIEYEFKKESFSELENFEKADTVFLHNGVFCRNYRSSIADTLIDEGIRRHELKVCYVHPSQNKIVAFCDRLLTSPNVRVLNHRFIESRRNNSQFLYWVLAGFFLGMVVEFAITLKKNPRTN